jgi:rRNA processing protein Krr1/Pno1
MSICPLILTHTPTPPQVPDKGSSDKWVTIKGPPEGVAMAKQAITELAEKGYSSVTDPDTCEGKVVVPQASRSTLIGPGGAHIKAITAHTGAQIKLPKRGDTQSGNDAVVIIGSRDEVREAKLLIKELLETGITQVTHPGMIIGRMAFPFERVGWLVGHAGHTVKSIQGNTKTKITIPKTAGQMVVIVGTQEGIAAAIKEITRVITPPEPEPEPTVDELRNDKNNEWSHVPQYDW